MEPEDVDAIVEIERRAFTRPWRREHFLFEIEKNRWAVNRVVRVEGRVAAYTCCWVLHGELKINDFAVLEEFRGKGLGRWLLQELLDDARERGCSWASLEVRENNDPALALYRRAGFEEIGRRKNYYEGDGEDALVMALRWERT
jgi:ribosomal-protein-alanine N-acetyltransferase